MYIINSYVRTGSTFTNSSLEVGDDVRVVEVKLLVARQQSKRENVPSPELWYRNEQGRLQAIKV
jgi:hypothetical protein